MIGDVFPMILANFEWGWLSILAASATIAVMLGGTIVTTVWLTGGFHGRE